MSSWWGTRRSRYSVERARTRARSTLAPLALALALAGCSLFRGSPPETFDLSGPQAIPKGGGSTAAQLLVPESTAIKVLDTERIVVTSGPKISYYPAAQWPDRLPKLFQARAIEAFDRSKRARAVGRPGEGLSIDYQVQTDIRSFEYRADLREAHVEVFARVLDDRTGRVVATRLFSADSPVGADKAPSVVAGVQSALDKVLVALVRWTVGQI
jgi:cholesterol transport system auxiliary component